MSEFTIVRQEFRKGFDEQGNPVVGPYYTFLVDGAPSLFWQPECSVPGLPKTYYIDRTINRLKAGRSEAFGPPMVAVGGKPVVPASALGLDGKEKKNRARVFKDDTPPVLELVTVHGGGTKPRESRPGYRYELDGVTSAETYPSEAAARAACAVKAFMTRSKLGRLEEAKATFEAANPGLSCTVYACPKEHTIYANVNGVKYSVGFASDEITFKALPNEG